MNITVFNRTYWIRRFSEQTEVNGYLVADYEDLQVSIHVHPASEYIRGNPEGERLYETIEAHSSVPIYAAKESEGRKADLLYFDEKWYECIESCHWFHTVLEHWNARFVLVPDDGSRQNDIGLPPIESGYAYVIDENGNILADENYNGLTVMV